MTKEKSAFKASPASPPASGDGDLSAEINAVVEKQVGETVKCVHLFDDNYRCNWWSPEAVASMDRMPAGFGVSVLRVRKSSFLRANKTSGELQILDMTLAVSPRSRLK